LRSDDITTKKKEKQEKTLGVEEHIKCMNKQKVKQKTKNVKKKNRNELRKESQAESSSRTW